MLVDFLFHFDRCVLHAEINVPRNCTCYHLLLQIASVHYELRKVELSTFDIFFVRFGNIFVSQFYEMDFLSVSRGIDGVDLIIILVLIVDLSLRTDTKYQILRPQSCLAKVLCSFNHFVFEIQYRRRRSHFNFHGRMLDAGRAWLPKVFVRLVFVSLDGFVNLVRNEQEVEVVWPTDWQWQSQVRIKGNRNVAASRASYSALQLAVHEVDNDALIACQECLPEASTHFLVRLRSIMVRHFYVRLLFYSVEVLVDQVEEVIDKLARVLLTVSAESCHSLSEHSLQLVWRCSSILVQPHLGHQFGEGGCQATL